MTEMCGKVFDEMISYYQGDPMRMHHFTKVFAYASWIGQAEHLNEKEFLTLQIAALTHDIGIKYSEEHFQTSNGKYQEKYGPDIARKMLDSLGVEPEVVERVCYLIGHHHTYTDIDGLDYQILVEADFIVNIYEDECGMEAAKSAYENIFKTETGRKIFSICYDIKF